MKQVAIIGGGPAGIALALELDKRKIPYVLFEAGQLAATWNSVPSNLTVLSPWWTNTLRWRDMLSHNPFSKVPAGKYHHYLLDMARNLRGEINQNTRVVHLTRDSSSRWIVHTEHGKMQVFSGVVLATGYFCSPKGAEPEFFSDGTIPILHSSDIKDYQQLQQFLEAKLPILVVGKRVTAGQLLIELHKRHLPTLLSVKSIIEYRRHGIIAALREQLYFFWEELELWLRPGLKRNSYPAMDGGLTQQLIDSGTIELLPTITSVSSGEAIFSDQSKRACAAIICATGYNPCVELLSPWFSSLEHVLPAVQNYKIEGLPNLFLLGFDNITNHRSRYLRGIRQDAVLLARQLEHFK